MEDYSHDVREWQEYDRPLLQETTINMSAARRSAQTMVEDGGRSTSFTMRFSVTSRVHTKQQIPFVSAELSDGHQRSFRKDNSVWFLCIGFNIMLSQPDQVVSKDQTARTACSKDRYLWHSVGVRIEILNQRG